MPVTHPTYCTLCGEPAEEVAVGEVFQYIDAQGKVIGYDHPGGPLSAELMEHEVAYTFERIDGTRVPGGGPCPNCVAEIVQHRKECELEVVNGGVHWHCVVCRLFGVVVRDDTQGFSKRIRVQAGVQPPQQVGVKFTQCTQHESEEDNIGCLH